MISRTQKKKNSTYEKERRSMSITWFQTDKIKWDTQKKQIHKSLKKIILTKTQVVLK